ncbi:MAG: hypothetical protein ACP5HS_08460 [Anaerolineae bacterium]
MNGLGDGHAGRDLFRVHARDLDRLAQRMERFRKACDLSEIAHRFIKGRLRYGSERTVPLELCPSPSERVRIWDPSVAWHQGDTALFAVATYRDRVRVLVPRVGEIVKVQGKGVAARIDGEASLRILGTATAGRAAGAVTEWRQAVEDMVAVLRERSDDVSRIEYVLWCYGEEILSVLLCALRQDARFVELNGQWFLRELAVMPTQAQLEALARAMLWSTEQPPSASELMSLLPASMTHGAAGLFGLSLALYERPDLFTRVGEGSDPRWILASPPPGPYVARWAAYDPDSYTLLCLPGEVLEPATVQRLWELDLLPSIANRRVSSGDERLQGTV